MAEQTAYPLCWPAGVPRTRNRERASFGKRDSTYGHASLTIADARERIYEEFERLRVEDFILSSNVELTLRGIPRSNQAAPADPGVCVYFKLKGKPHAMPCDKWDRVADNMAAIAKHVDAMRGMSRWGVADVAQMFTGFQALPAPEAVRTWWDVLGVPRESSLNEVSRARNALAFVYHPDRGGSNEKMAEINAAWESAKAEKEGQK